MTLGTASPARSRDWTNIGVMLVCPECGRSLHDLPFAGQVNIRIPGRRNWTITGILYHDLMFHGLRVKTRFGLDVMQMKSEGMTNWIQPVTQTLALEFRRPTVYTDGRGGYSHTGLAGRIREILVRAGEKATASASAGR